MNSLGRSRHCSQPELSAYLTPYCFGDLSEHERALLEVHVLECEACWRELERLASAVRVLRTDASLKQTVATPELFGLLGMSGGLEERFGGHAGFAAATSVLYGVLYAASVWTELGYAYDRFGGLAWTLSPLVFLVMAGALASGLWMDHRLVVRSDERGLLWSASIVIGAALAVAGAAFVVLPSEPTIDAAFQTRSAWIGYQKNVVSYFLPLLIFVLPPFHAVLALQRELSLGRHQAVLEVLTNAPGAVLPRGVWLVRPWVLWIVFGAAVVIGFQGVNQMLDGLAPGPNANLFAEALHMRVWVWYLAAVLAQVWYQRSLNEIMREAVAVVRLTGVAETRH